MNRTLAAATACLFLAVPANANSASDPAISVDVDRIVWQRVNPDGTKYALLEGVRDRAGVAFSYAFFIPAGVWDAPHSHTATARVFVARGTLKLGYGDRLDKAKAQTFVTGSYLVVPANSRHFDGSDVDTIILGTAVGPWSTVYAEADPKPSAGTEAE